jgi:hypothetical protein
VDRTAARAACLTGVVHTAGSGHGCSPRGLLEEMGAEGNFTVVGGGRHRNGAMPAMSFDGGGYLLSMTSGSGWGEAKVGVALDAVESGRGIGAFYMSGNDGRRAVLSFDSAPRGGEMKGWDRERRCR